jgi:hypothetical protein
MQYVHSKHREGDTSFLVQGNYRRLISEMFMEYTVTGPGCLNCFRILEMLGVLYLSQN